MKKKISTFQCNINLSNITVLVGKSGSVKHLLRLISGLDYIENASIKFNKIIWQEKGYFLATEKETLVSFSIRLIYFLIWIFLKI